MFVLGVIQSECGKIWTRITPNKDTFYAVSVSYLTFTKCYILYYFSCYFFLLSFGKQLELDIMEYWLEKIILKCSYFYSISAIHFLFTKQVEQLEFPYQMKKDHLVDQCDLTETARDSLICLKDT